MPIRLAVAAALTLTAIASAPAFAAERPSFDCSTAKTPRERVVCGDDRLARADRDMAAAFGEVRKRLSPADAKLLLADQKQFLEALEDGFDAQLWFKGGAPDDPAQITADIRRVLREKGETLDGLAEELARRAAMLRGIVTDRTGFVGGWMAYDVALDIAPAKGGAHAVVYTAPSYGWPKYRCAFRGEARPAPAGLSIEKPRNIDYDTADDEPRDSRFDLTRDGIRLHLVESMDPGDNTLRVCGHRTGIDDRLFAVRPEAMPKRRSP